MSLGSLQEWLDWLESCHPAEIDLGLERVGAVAERMSLSKPSSKVITVAGTNGKGSCVASLTALLLSADYRVGSFTSPHFIHFNERIQINGEPVVDQLLIESFERIDRARGDISLSYFEFSTLAGLDIFSRSDLDVLVLEVGLGGRLDAVNIVDADVAIVTSIDIDHQSWLGSDRESIGFEKAGIFRPNRPAVSSGINPPLSLQQAATACGAPFYQQGKEFDFSRTSSGSWRWRGQSTSGEVFELTLTEPNLPPESVSAAIQAIQLLGIPLSSIDYRCLETISLTGRFQQLIVNQRQVILDVAHNPAAAKFLAQRLQQNPPRGRNLALIAVMADKDVEGIVAELGPTIDAWFVCSLKDTSRAIAEDQLADIIRHQSQSDVCVMGSVDEATPQVLSQMQLDDRLLVLGSFFTVAGVLRAVTHNHQKNITQVVSEINP